MYNIYVIIVLDRIFFFYLLNFFIEFSRNLLKFKFPRSYNIIFLDNKIVSNLLYCRNFQRLWQCI